MRFLLGLTGCVLLAGVLWTVLVVALTLEGVGRQSIAPEADHQAFFDAAVSKVSRRLNGNVAMLLIRDDKIFAEYYRSTGAGVHRNTPFQIASLSKWITAYGVMILVQDGRLELDKPVSSYLSRWQLPASEYDLDGVTARRLLSHTAGLTDGLGFAGYLPGQTLPKIEEALSHPNATAGEGVEIIVGNQPGSSWDYSGGGYLMLQLLIEEVSGEPFNDYMKKAVFNPLEMTNSSFQLDADEKNSAARSYDENGQEAVLYDFVAVGAAGLYTTAPDLAGFVSAQLNSEVLQSEHVLEMRQPFGQMFGLDLWGLGTILYAPLNDDVIFGHDGSNDPAINSAVRVNPLTRDAFIMLETGDPLLATELGGDWVFWQSGVPGTLTLTREAGDIIVWVIVGWMLAITGGLAVFGYTWFRRRRPG